MAQGEFTKQECDETMQSVDEMFRAIPRSKQMQYLGHLNDVLLFLGAARAVAPDEPELKQIADQTK
jgi:hypothetical protein